MNVVATAIITKIGLNQSGRTTGIGWQWIRPNYHRRAQPLWLNRSIQVC